MVHERYTTSKIFVEHVNTNGYSIVRWKGSALPDRSVLRRTLADEGYLVLEWSDGPDTIYGVHKHETDQSHWIISGTLELEVAGFGKVVLNAGDRDFMPAGTEHSARVLGGVPVVYLIGEKR